MTRRALDAPRAGRGRIACRLALAVVLLAALPLASVATGHAPGPVDPVAAVDARTLTAPPPVPLLWKVSDADNAVYLLGSFHLLKPDDYPLSADIDAAFAAAERLVFEVDPVQLADPGNAAKLAAVAGYGDARTLSTVLPPALHATLARLLVERGTSAAQFEAYEPWFVNLSLVLGLSRSLGFSAEQGLDQHLMQAAAAAGKPTAGLESLDAQLRALDGSPMAEQVVALADFLDRPQAMPDLLAQLHAAWRNGDVAALDALSRAEMRDKTPQTYRVVNVERNDAWLPQLRRLLDATRGDTLVVVGALHLLGDDGVVEKLRARGYQVERICNACASR